MSTHTRATMDDLFRAGGKAELIQGEIVPMSPTGGLPNRVAANITFSLRQHERKTHSGYAFADNTAFHVDLPNRESFSPDAGYYIGPAPTMRFYEGAPAFAVEIRSQHDDGPQAEQRLAEKRADYFAAGTQVVWDVDLRGSDIVRKYTADRPESPTVFRRGDVADAKPAVVGWKMPVDEFFE